ncbi:hypothetical protein [Paenibacillus glycanilyticus]|uniref:hypothetical protein n=1 Tax=Paenibacillus glycanilyticus TaxID=126569 RepID=UPI000FDCB417|nr:hypothetical protein [Paenibacillus glycanilyticus]
MKQLLKSIAGGSQHLFKEIKSALIRFITLLYPLRQGGKRLLYAGIILAVVWYGFIYLTESPTNSSSALIMVWASAVILVFAFFPNIIDKIKRFKFKDVEIELNVSVSKSYYEYLIKFDMASQITGYKEVMKHSLA